MELEKKENHGMAFHERGLRNFVPWYVSSHNSASNVGLSNLIMEVLKASLSAFAREEYSFLRADVSIFRSYLMVLFFSPLAC